MRIGQWLMLIVAGSMGVTCQKENPDVICTLENKISKKSSYHYIDDEIPLVISEYQYHDDCRIERIDHFSGHTPTVSYSYELFAYKENDEIQKKLTYHYINDSIGWGKHDSTYYYYEDGLLINKEINYLILPYDIILYKYEYTKSMLKKEYMYYNGQLRFLIIYEYQDNLCVKESLYSDSTGLNLFDYIVHHFENGVLSLSERFGRDDKIMQQITYTYNAKGNLIIEEAIKKDPIIVKSLSYVYRYEYF